jgi:hypothetical protein
MRPARVPPSVFSQMPPAARVDALPREHQHAEADDIRPALSHASAVAFAAEAVPSQTERVRSHQVDEERNRAEANEQYPRPSLEGSVALGNTPVLQTASSGEASKNQSRRATSLGR